LDGHAGRHNDGWKQIEQSNSQLSISLVRPHTIKTRLSGAGYGLTRHTYYRNLKIIRALWCFYALTLNIVLLRTNSCFIISLNSSQCLGRFNDQIRISGPHFDSASFVRTSFYSGYSTCGSGDAGKLIQEDGEVQDASCRDQLKDKDETLSLFWNSFYQKLNAISSVKKPSNATQYHDKVIQLLLKYQSQHLSLSELKELQKQIEDLSMTFDEKSIFKNVPNLIKLLIIDDESTAKAHLTNNLSENDLTYIRYLGKYTLEAIIIHVLGSVFSPLQDLSVVRVSTLIQQLDSTVRVQSVKMGMNNEAAAKLSLNNGKKSKVRVSRSNSAIGVGLVEFMVSRGLISLKVDTLETDKLPVSRIKGYVPSQCYAIFNFDLSILPIKLNLPMVCKPLPWQSKVDRPSTLEDVSGGYLCGLTGEIYNRFRLLTSRNYNNFFIELCDPMHMCSILTELQSQAFEINKTFLSFIMENRDTLEVEGLLVNRCLAKVNLKEASDLLRFSYFNNDEGVMEVCRCDVLLTDLFHRVQRARYEDFVLLLATAYSGYRFYLPAFIDFRGRIYRAGVLHFHERDLARSLIVFASDAQAPQELSQPEDMSLRFQLACAAAFKYQNFIDFNHSYSWYMNKRDEMVESDNSLIHLALQASDPFQFIAKVLSNERVSDIERMKGYHIVPVTQDASASAYQIMSYLLLNVEMARLTNLIPSKDNQIQDLYLYLKKELMKYLHSAFDPNKYAIIESRLTRKHVKKLFMPLIYGKSVIAMAGDIREIIGSLLSVKEHYSLAKLCDTFWRTKYPDIANLMKFINLIGWFSAVLEKPVFYSIPFFKTVQDYRRFNKEFIWVYDRVSRKRHKVTLQVPTLDRDTRKTQVATCVNFIHQKDAYLAMRVVENLVFQKAPVYTVHDNFITTAVSAALVPQIYTNLFIEMGAPLAIINEFVSINLNLPISRVSNAIPGSELQTHLRSLVPDNLSQNDKKKWYQKIEDTVRCYELYVYTVCGMDNHADEKWYSFFTHLDSWKSRGFNYSVHY